MELFNRGDTAYLLLNITLNGEPMVQGAYQEMELQFNRQDNMRSIKKLYSRGEIVYMVDMEYKNAYGETQTFTGYVCALNQEDTFLISSGETDVQLRVLYNNEVGSTGFMPLNIGKALSNEVLT